MYDSPTPPCEDGRSSVPKCTDTRSSVFPVDQSECIVAVMGATGTGKTTFINKASGGSLQVGMDLYSCTSTVQIASRFELDGRSVTLIDTPGFDDTTKSDAEILRMIAAFLATGYEQGRKLAGVIYIHRISDNRMSGISSRNFKMFRELCGDSTLKNVIIVTNMWGTVSQAVGEAREDQLRTKGAFFKPVLDKGAVLLRHEDTHESAIAVLRHIIKNKPIVLQIQRELVDEKKDISETGAGAEINRELMEQIRKHRQELTEVKEEMAKAIRAKDEETRQELEASSKKLQEDMRRFQNESENLASQYKEEKARTEQQLQEMIEKTRRDAEKAAAQHSQQLSVLQEALAQTSSAATQQRAHFESKIAELERNQHKHSSGGCCIQ